VDNPCNHTQVRELMKSVRSGHAKRGVKPDKKDALTKEPLQAVLTTCDDSPRGLRDRALLLFGWASGGRRRSEIAGAAMENLRSAGARGYLYTLGHSKTNQAGEIRPEDDKPIAGMAAAALAQWLEVSGITEGPIFRRIFKGGRILEDGLDPTAVRKIVQQRCLQAGLSGDFSAHSLRSGFVTEAGRRRMDTADAMAMTGHRNYETFMGYYRAEDPLNREASRMLDEDDAVAATSKSRVSDQSYVLPIHQALLSRAHAEYHMLQGPANLTTLSSEAGHPSVPARTRSRAFASLAN
jgi:integrase